MKLISVIVPCYNEEEVLHATHEQLSKVLVALSDYRYELIYVNDGSRDQTLPMLRQIAAADSRVKLLSFSRNFGHQIAITAGLDYCSGDAAVVIDADLQDPPHLIPDMISAWEQGSDVVYGKRRDREGETFFKLFTARLFYRFINRLADVDIPLDTGDFRLMSRKALDAFLKLREQHRFVRGMVAWVGFKQTALEYDREARFAGTTKYPLRKMLRLAFDAIVGFSNVPLRLATFMGFITSLLAFAGILYSLYVRIFTDETVAGWTFLMIAILFIGGISLIVLGIIGEYIGRIYSEIKQRPLYLIQEQIGFTNKEQE
jgi:glycosyltransferase involved in cell wall biosynthesis